METTPGSVRAEARQALALWDLGDAVDVIDLVATELATNAVRASRPMRLAGQAPVIRVCLLTNRLVARVEVWDEAPGFPVLRDTDTDAENGRGLILVNDLTSGMWGWGQVAALLPAKCVWAEIPLTAVPPVPPETRNGFSPAIPDPHALDMRAAPAGEQPQQATGPRLLPAATAGRQASTASVLAFPAARPQHRAEPDTESGGPNDPSTAAPLVDASSRTGSVWALTAGNGEDQL